MRRAIVPFTLAVFLFLSLAAAQFLTASEARATEVGGRRNVGLGFAVGSQSSLVGKVFLGGANAFDFGLSFFRRACYRDGQGPDGCDRFGLIGLYGDYLWKDTLARGTAQLDWHLGVGARMWVGDDRYADDFFLGPRMPIGIDLTFDRPSFLEVFFDIAPVFYIVPFTDLDIEAQIGVRLYF